MNGGSNMSLTVAEAERKIISEWRVWPKEHGGGSTQDMMTFYFTWLPKNRPDLLRFRGKGDSWQRVKGWLQNSEDRQPKLR